jgi:hypothetical protein
MSGHIIQISCTKATTHSNLHKLIASQQQQPRVTLEEMIIECMKMTLGQLEWLTKAHVEAQKIDEAAIKNLEIHMR